MLRGQANAVFEVVLFAPSNLRSVLARFAVSLEFLQLIFSRLHKLAEEFTRCPFQLHYLRDKHFSEFHSNLATVQPCCSNFSCWVSESLRYAL